MEGTLLAVPSSPPAVLDYFHLGLTIFFQVGILGTGLLILALKVVPSLNNRQRLAMSYPPGLGRALRLFPSFFLKGVWFILLTGTLGILLTDVGWPKAFAQDSLPDALLFARASGAPNGAHLLSYIPLPVLGLYVAWKYRKDVLLDCFQGIIIVAFGVAVHELIWIVAYYIQWGRFLTLASWTNATEDMFFTLMCVMFVYAFWKYPLRTIPFKAFKWPILIYTAFVIGWLADGLPITTINNFILGKGIYGVTALWGDPLTNLIEIASWVLVAVLFFGAIWHERLPPELR